jgi:hypothetical protein
MKFFNSSTEAVVACLHFLATIITAVVVALFSDQNRTQKYRTLFFIFLISATIALAGIFSLWLVPASYFVLMVAMFVLWRRAIRDERISAFTAPVTIELGESRVVAELLPSSDPAIR